MTSDKSQLAMSDGAREAADAVQEAAGFHDRQDLYRLAIAVALVKELPPASESISRGNYVGVGGLDPDHSIRTAVLELRSDHGGRPYALVERLAESGLEDLRKHFNEGKSVREYLDALVKRPTNKGAAKKSKGAAKKSKGAAKK